MTAPLAAGGVRDSWSSRLTFVLATCGGAVGLGNLWRFSYVAGENGGGAFVIIYLGIVLLVGVPLVMAELALGRRGQASPLTTMRKMTAEVGGKKIWNFVGWFSVLAPMGALMFYAVVAGWSLEYLLRAVSGQFQGISAGEASAAFDTLLASPLRLLAWHTLFMAGTIFVVALGLQKGIEPVTTFMMPALFLMIFALAIYAHVAGAPAEAWRFLFNPDFSKLTAESWLVALGQALFSVTIGTGALLTYGGYLGDQDSLIKPAWQIVIADTGIALIAGLAIFPIVFATGLDPGQGPGLMFVTLPLALGQMPGGYVIAIMLFVTVFFAAFTSALVMLEPYVGYLEEHVGIRRGVGATVVGSVIWLMGVAAALSFNVWGEFRPLGFLPLYADKNIFGVIEFTVANIMLPANAFMLAVFCGWIFHRHVLRDEIGIRSPGAYRVWSFLVRYVAPVGVGAVLIASLVGTQF